MDIFQFAMEREKVSEECYRKLAEKSAYSGLRNICNMLADEERKHYQIVEQMSQNIPVEITQTPLLNNVRGIFEKMRQSTDKFNFEASELELYQKARDIEKESKAFYLEKAEQVNGDRQKGIFKKLVNEEQKHLTLLQNICDFVAKPQWFLENAEMYRFEDYADGVL